MNSWKRAAGKWEAYRKFTLCFIFKFSTTEVIKFFKYPTDINSQSWILWSRFGSDNAHWIGVYGGRSRITGRRRRWWRRWVEKDLHFVCFFFCCTFYASTITRKSLLRFPLSATFKEGYISIYNAIYIYRYIPRYLIVTHEEIFFLSTRRDGVLTVYF